MEKEYWKLDGDKIIIKNKKYSIFYVTLISFLVKLVSIALIAYSAITFLTLEKTTSIAGMGLAIFTFLFGYFMGKIAKKANEQYLDERNEKVLLSHKEKIKRIRSEGI